MEILYALEKIRFASLDKLMLLVTGLGSETVFLALALTMYWCVSKREGYYLVSVGFLGTIFNQFLKLYCRVPRPWVRNPNFTAVESALPGASGYSFPSGHSQSAVGTFGVIGAETKRHWIRAVSIVLMLLVPFSRLYLGVHTPADVLVGGVCALVLVFSLRPLVYSSRKWVFPALLVVQALCGLAFLAYVKLTDYPPDIDPGNLAHAAKNAYTLLGAMLGFLLAYFIEDRYIRFSVKAVWWAQVLKVLLGLTLAVAIKELLKVLFIHIFGDFMILHTLRYFLVVIFAALLWPMTFKWFAKLGGKWR